MSPLAKNSIPIPRPPFRRLRVYAFDPSLATQLETAVVNQACLKVPWENRSSTEPHSACEEKIDSLLPGPVGEYLEVVDFDPASRCFYEPVDLNDARLLAQDGLDPSEGSPQFHQLMVYAVAMTTIRNFERALGRRALWAPRFLGSTTDAKDLKNDEPVTRLRVYPHALREANAYYSPAKKALLFGYFAAAPTSPGCDMRGGMVFTCLSHDIIAHETTHALLDGMHRRFVEPSNPDALAFHEAFADIVALFQHFSFPEVLRHQIAKTRGDLASQNLLGQLAQQLGQATGRYGALRDALGVIDDQSGQWKPKEPDPEALERTFEPHARGCLLVAAVFDAFLSIYRSRIADLLRIATSGSGVLPAGQLHPDLINRLAGEAAKSARHVCTMCIRALDYCPPVDITFGEYLRALITADYDLVPDDPRNYRIAMIEAFRRRGIYPRDVRTMSVDSLRWQVPTWENWQQMEFPGASIVANIAEVWGMSYPRDKIYNAMRSRCVALHNWLFQKREDPAKAAIFNALGLAIEEHNVEVHSVRPARRIGPEGQTVTEIVIEITQKRPGYFSDDPAKQDHEKPDFYFRGGCTLIVEPATWNVRYCIKKSVSDTNRYRSQRQYLTEIASRSLRATYFGLGKRDSEPFAVLHRSFEEDQL